MNPDKLIQEAGKKCEEAKFFIIKYSETENDNTLLARALELYYESISIYPRQSEPYIAIAFISVITNHLNEAKNLLQKALEIDPLNLFAIKMLKDLRTRIAKEKMFPVQQHFEIKKDNKSAKAAPLLEDPKPLLQPLETTLPEQDTEKTENIYSKREFIANLKNIQKEMQDNKIKISVNENTFNKLSALSGSKPRVNVPAAAYPGPVKNEKEHSPRQKEKPETPMVLPGAPEKIKIKVSENTLNILAGNAKKEETLAVINLFDD